MRYNTQFKSKSKTEKATVNTPDIKKQKSSLTAKSADKPKAAAVSTPAEAIPETPHLELPPDVLSAFSANKPVHDKILACVRLKSMTTDEIAHAAELPASETLCGLTELEVLGKVKPIPGGKFEIILLA
jgi:predicted Rossmann fold nucleotide-binding protein DprA/Smf involved in DNA uptake